MTDAIPVKEPTACWPNSIPPSDLVRAAQQAAYEDGWRRLDCYTPYPVEEAAEAIGFHRNHVPLVTLIGGLMGWPPCSAWRPGSRSGRIR